MVRTLRAFAHRVEPQPVQQIARLRERVLGRQLQPQPLGNPGPRFERINGDHRWSAGVLARSNVRLTWAFGNCCGRGRPRLKASWKSLTHSAITPGCMAE